MTLGLAIIAGPSVLHDVSVRIPRAARPHGPTTALGLVLHGTPKLQISGPLATPSPSCPCPLWPQQYARLVVVTPQLWYPPIETPLKASPPRTATGVRRLVSVPSPTPPVKLSPQQYALFAVVTPQVCAPGVTWAKLRLPLTGAGVRRWVSVPSPK